MRWGSSQSANVQAAFCGLPKPPSNCSETTLLERTLYHGWASVSSITVMNNGDDGTEKDPPGKLSQTDEIAKKRACNGPKFKQMKAIKRNIKKNKTEC
jgi:hypothetical protein